MRRGIYVSPDLRLKIVRLHIEHDLSRTTLAERFQVTPSTISRILIEAGISTKKTA